MKKISVLIAIIGILLVGCDEKKMEKKSYTVGIDANSGYPFEYKNNCSGVIEGFEPELMIEIAKRGNFKIDFVESSFLSIVPRVKEGNLDMGVGFISITDERKKIVDFSEVYYISRVVVLGNKENTDVDKEKTKITKENISTTKKKLIFGFPKGTYFKNYVKEMKNAVVVEDIDRESVMEKLISKEIDYTIADSRIGTRYIQKNPMIYEERTIKNDSIAIIFSKELPESFKNKVNTIIIEMKKDGTLDLIKKKYNVE